jgi:hypothetical protein
LLGFFYCLYGVNGSEVIHIGVNGYCPLSSTVLHSNTVTITPHKAKGKQFAVTLEPTANTKSCTVTANS